MKKILVILASLMLIGSLAFTVESCAKKKTKVDEAFEMTLQAIEAAKKGDVEGFAQILKESEAFEEDLSEAEMEELGNRIDAEVSAEDQDAFDNFLGEHYMEILQLLYPEEDWGEELPDYEPDYDGEELAELFEELVEE